MEKNVKLLDNEARIVLFNPLCGGHFIEITVDSSCEVSSSCIIVVDGERSNPFGTVGSLPSFPLMKTSRVWI